MIRHYVILLLALFLPLTVFCQTQSDTIYTYKSLVPVVIDGSDADVCWAEAEWHPISQVWIPYGASMAAGDFEGRYKVAWDSSYLYVLVEVTDDVLSDDHSNPLQNWWDDDCVEVFIDENRSKGVHETNNNAFAYHVSMFYDAIDMNSSGAGVNYKQNLQVVMDTVTDHIYLWELAIRMYSATFSLSNPEASRVWLTNNKLMGFTIAYCDNDNTTSRENFIGSMYMTSATANDNYKTANYFGSMLLVDQTQGGSSIPEKQGNERFFTVSPNPAGSHIRIEQKDPSANAIAVELLTASGKLVKSVSLESPGQEISTSDLPSGIYFIILRSGLQFQAERILIL
jgi:hypothetical protein